MRRLFTYLRRYRGRYALGLFCLFATASLAMTVPYLVKVAVDAYVAGDGAAAVARYALWIGIIAVAQAIVRTFSRFVIFNVGRDVEYDIRNDLFAKLETLPQGYYQTRHTGDLMSRLVNDITAIRLLLGPGSLNVINTTMYYAYGVTVMCTFDPALTFWALLPYPLLLVVVKYFSRQIIEGSLRVQQGLGELSTRVQENLSGIAVVQAYAREAHETRLFTALNDRFAAENMALARARGRLLPVMKLVASTGTVVVLWVGGRHVMAGILSIGDLFAFIGYLNMLAWPTMAMGWMLSVVQRGRAALQRLEDIFAAPAEIADRPGAVAPATTRGEVEFRGVDFAYRTAENGRPVLSGFDLRIPAGSTVAVVGRTAAGKSALVQLLPRLFDPTAGAVLLDGHDLRDLPLAWLRRQVTIVPQDPFLFSTTLRANIAFGVDPAAGNGVALDARVRQAAVAAGLERDLARLPKGLDTLVGERGVTLSGGQKQRVTLARALLTNPRVLVLDDALSSVDAETERAVLGHLAAYRRGRTSIIVAHRASTVRDADLIVVVDAGAIVERGTHEALLAQDGLYAELFRRQVLEEELERI